MVKTLYKGRADISVAVFDVAQGGSVVYRKNFVEYEFPKLDGPSVVDTTEAKFRILFLTIVSKQIGALFYPHDPRNWPYSIRSLCQLMALVLAGSAALAGP